MAFTSALLRYLELHHCSTNGRKEWISMAESIQWNVTFSDNTFTILYSTLCTVPNNELTMNLLVVAKSASVFGRKIAVRFIHVLLVRYPKDRRQRCFCGWRFYCRYGCPLSRTSERTSTVPPVRTTVQVESNALYTVATFKCFENVTYGFCGLQYLITD